MKKEVITPEMVKSYVMAMPIHIAGDNAKLSEYVSNKTDNGHLAVAIALSAARAFKTVHEYGCPATSKLTFQELENWSEQCRVNFAVVHRCNHLLYTHMLELLDVIDERNMRRGNSQKYIKPMQKEFNHYLATIRSGSPKLAFTTWQDHIRLANDTVEPKVEELYTSCRDRMIAFGESFRELHHIKDIGFLAQAEVVLLLARMAKYTFRDYFKQYEEECGVDFSRHYAYADMGNMSAMFIKMLGELGVSFQFNDHHDLDIRGFDFRDGVRCYAAWNAVIGAMRDEDALEAAAQHALDLNPKAKIEFAETIAAVEREHMDEALDKLKGKFTVKEK